jgi:DNA polymerase III epsilon subunit-like protein
VLGLDCEMVYAKGDPNALARVSVVSFGGTLLDAYVHRLPGAILDYRTPISGVEAKHLTQENGATTFEAVQEKVLALITSETILVGHALQNDLRALRIMHHKIVDTAFLFAVEGKAQTQKHKLHSLVSLMKKKVATLALAGADQAHDSKQDATWALQLALYEASIHPHRTGPLKLETFPTKVFLSEIPKGTTSSDIQALFRGGDVGEIHYQLEPSGEWQGRTTVTFSSQADRDAAMSAVARFPFLHVGPMRDWAARNDVDRMQTELSEYFSRRGGVGGRVKNCRVFYSRASHQVVAQLNCHPVTARAILTAEEPHRFATHRSPFEVRLSEDEAAKRRCIVPVGGGQFLAKVQ